MYGEKSENEEKDKGYPYEKADLIGISNIFVAEFNALRREIEININHQKDMMNFSFLTFTAIVGLFGVIKTEKTSQLPSYIYLIFPWIFFLLILLYADKVVRILRVADYIQNHLRKKIILFCDENFWQWELYKSHEFYPPISRRVALLLDRTRWFIFIGPSIISLALFLDLYCDTKSIVDLFGDPELLIFLLVDAAVIVYIYIGVILRLEETMGVKNREDVTDLDGFEKDKIAEGVARAVVENFDELPKNIREDLLLTLSKKDRFAGAAANAIVKNFDKLPKNVREDLLLTLSKKDETAGIAANVIAKHFKKLPEDMRRLLFEFSEKDETAGIAANVIAKHFKKLPEDTRKDLLLKLVRNDKTEKEKTENP